MIHWTKEENGSYSYGGWRVELVPGGDWTAKDPNGKTLGATFQDVTRALQFAEKRMERKQP